MASKIEVEVDYTSEEGAIRLAAIIKDRWAQQGVVVNTWIQPISIVGKGTFYCVRSDIQAKHAIGAL
jgi:hypothetical protein